MTGAAAARPAIERLDPARHDRQGFSCGVAALDRYLHTQAGQEAKRHVAVSYVLCQPPATAVMGFYTLSSASILLSALPASLARKLPRYPSMPATLLGRLAVDARYRGGGWGTVLLMDALHRCFNSEIATLAVMVDAKDDAAVAFYRHHEFIPLPEQPRRLFKPMAEIQALFRLPASK